MLTSFDIDSTDLHIELNGYNPHLVRYVSVWLEVTLTLSILSAEEK